MNTDIIEPEPTDLKPALQRFVPGPMTESGTIVHREFYTPQFKPVKKGLKSLDTIKVNIQDELGRPVQFTGGKVSLTLCLRQARLIKK